jgi:hypothetical protein
MYETQELIKFRFAMTLCDPLTATNWNCLYRSANGKFKIDPYQNSQIKEKRLNNVNMLFCDLTTKWDSPAFDAFAGRIA